MKKSRRSHLKAYVSVIIKNDNRQFFEADKIITAMLLALNLELMNKLKGTVSATYTVGDCTNPGIIPDAIVVVGKSVIKYKT